MNIAQPNLGKMLMNKINVPAHVFSISAKKLMHSAKDIFPMPVRDNKFDWNCYFNGR